MTTLIKVGQKAFKAHGVILRTTEALAAGIPRWVIVAAMLRPHQSLANRRIIPPTHTPSCCRLARFRAGPPMRRFLSTRNGNMITRPASSDLFVMAWMYRWRICLSMWRDQCRPMRTAPAEREVRVRHFCIAAWRPCLKLRDGSD